MRQPPQIVDWVKWVGLLHVKDFLYIFTLSVEWIKENELFVITLGKTKIKQIKAIYIVFMFLNNGRIIVGIYI